MTKFRSRTKFFERTVLASVVRAHFRELMTSLYIGFIILLLGSYAVYQLEVETNEQFQNYGDALWWGIVSLTTIGYGRHVPETASGRIVSSLFLTVGISFFALPAGILGTGFAFKVQEQHRQKHFARRRVPAAVLIQSAWRFYASRPDNDHLTATWMVQRPRDWKKILKLQPAEEKSSADKNNGPKTPMDTTVNTTVNTRINHRESFLRTRQTCPDLDAGMNAISEEKQPCLTSNSKPPPTSSKSTTLNFSPFAANSKFFGEASVKPIISASPFSTFLNDIVGEDETFSEEVSEVEKNCIRFIRRAKFQIARRKFMETLRPYDVQDIIEQYSTGSLEMMNRLKCLQASQDDIGSVVEF